jgi:hypothetical protein
MLTITLNLSRQFFLIHKQEARTTEQRILERGLQVLRTIDQKKFSNRCIMRYASKHRFETGALERIIERMRYRRQCLLHAAWVRPFNLRRWCILQRSAMRLQRQMEYLFVEFYRYSGDRELFDIILRTCFIRSFTIKQMLVARREHEKHFLW